MKDFIVYEDFTIIVVNKPAGLATQNTQNPNKENLYSNLQKYLNEREGKEIYLALHHRLDAPTSGLVIFCKNRNYNKAVTDLFRERKIKKTYLAVVDVLKEENLKDEWIVDNYLKTYKVRHFKKAKSATKGDHAETSFKLVKREGDRALVQCFPKTGRLHQIRVHLSELGLPVVGDFHYNKKKFKDGLLLHAAGLEFPHPKSGENLKLEVSPPELFDLDHLFRT